MMQNPSFGRLNRVRCRRKVGKSWSTKSSRRRREEHKKTKRYRGFLTSSDIGTYPAHAVLTEKFRWVSVIFRGCGRLIPPRDARPFSRAPRGVTARTLRVLLTPFTYCNTRKPMHSQNAPLNYRVIASPRAIRRSKTSMYVNASPFFPFVPFSTPRTVYPHAPADSIRGAARPLPRHTRALDRAARRRPRRARDARLDALEPRARPKRESARSRRRERVERGRGRAKR